MPYALAAANACIAILKPVELYKTTYPNKVFDYMAAGKPVILAIDGVIREVIENAEGGFQFLPEILKPWQMLYSPSLMTLNWRTGWENKHGSMWKLILIDQIWLQNSWEL